MDVRVLLFAGLRERAGVEEVTLTGLSRGLTLAELKLELAARHPELGSLEHVAGVVAEAYVDDSTSLEEGQEVALLPPVSGGEDAPEGPDPLSRGVFELASERLELEVLGRRVEHDSCGAVVTFRGHVRASNRGEDVRRIDYEAFAKMAGPQMERIFERCRREHGDGDGTRPERALRMLCVHRVGSVPVGEASVLIAVASPHREAAFHAARFLIDELKASLPVWKKEIYATGSHWIGDRS